jgi:hypothetical protein
MTVPQLKLRQLVLAAEQKIAVLLGNEKLYQTALENMVMLKTQMRVQQEKHINELLFKL